MNIGELFVRAVEALPDPVRVRLDGDVPLDWPVLADPALGAAVNQAAGDHRRLPEPAESLAHRLIRDVGIVPADIAAGVERQGAAIAWIHWVTLEADGESYQIRNDRSGEVHTGVRPEAVAGYTTLGMDLAAMIHDASERWIEVGERYRDVPEEDWSPLARCAVRMCRQLRVQPDAISGHPTAASLARTLEYAWNSQPAEARSALAGVRLSTARGARAPRRCYYAVSTSHHLRACEVGEIRWLRALADRADAAGRPEANERRPGRRAGEGGGDPPSLPAAAGGRRGARRTPDAREPSGLELGSPPEGLEPAAALDALGRTASHLPGGVRRRLGEAYGAVVAQALDRLEDRAELQGARREMEAAGGGLPGGSRSSPPRCSRTPGRRRGPGCAPVRCGSGPGGIRTAGIGRSRRSPGTAGCLPRPGWWSRLIWRSSSPGMRGPGSPRSARRARKGAGR